MFRKLPASLILLTFSFLPLYGQTGTADAAETILADELFPGENREMTQIREAFLSVSRADYLSSTYRNLAGKDIPLPAGGGLIHPAPSLIANILKEAAILPYSRVLIIGKNTEYLCDIVSRLTETLFVSDPGLKPGETEDYEIKQDLSYFGWIESSPFNCIILFGAVKEIPQGLITQLAPNGRILAPIESGTGNQILISAVKYSDSFSFKSIGGSYIHKLDE